VTLDPRDPLDALRAAIDAATEAGASYAVIGAMARNAWAPPRATSDFDLALVVDAEAYGRLIAALAARGFSVKQTIAADPDDPIPDVVLLDNPRALVHRTDLLIAKTPFEVEAVHEAVSHDIGVTCRIVRPEHLVVYKLIAHRPHDLDDAEDVMRTRQLAGEAVDLEVVRRWAVEWGVDGHLDALLARMAG
jgi:hypothetical protein